MMNNKINVIGVVTLTTIVFLWFTWELQSAPQEIEKTPAPPRAVYIDFGSNWANTFRLYETIVPESILRSHTWEIYAFEICPILHDWNEANACWLNGNCLEPHTNIPLAGSSPHLFKITKHTGCGQNRECIFEYYRKDLEALKPNPKIQDPAVIDQRLALAKQRNKDIFQPRYTFIGAGVDSMRRNVTMSYDIVRMIRGGILPSSLNEKGNTQRKDPATVIDAAEFIMSFSDVDYMVIKMDIEGFEKNILEKLNERNQLGKITKLAWECHGSQITPVGWCQKFTGILKNKGVSVIVETVDYSGWDKYHIPE